MKIPRRLSAPEAADILIKGGVVAFPTETVYGLGANALNPDAVARIFEIKKRPFFNPLICHLPDSESVFRYGMENPLARKLSKFWPGPLTILLPHENRIPKIVTASSPLCAFRVPDHPIALDLLKKTGVPIAAPSANLFGRRSPTSASMVIADLNGEIDGILDGGNCNVGIESTVVSIAGEKIQILRHGGVTIENLLHAGFDAVDISKISAPPETRDNSDLLSPGRLEHHYAPKTPLLFISLPDAIEFSNIAEKTDSFVKEIQNHLKNAAIQKISFLVFGHNDGWIENERIKNLSPSGNFREAAKNLFQLFDDLDTSKHDLIVSFSLPENSLGVAINDRLRKAAAYTARLKGKNLEKFQIKPPLEKK